MVNREGFYVVKISDTEFRLGGYAKITQQEKRSIVHNGLEYSRYDLITRTLVAAEYTNEDYPHVFEYHISCFGITYRFYLTDVYHEMLKRLIYTGERLRMSYWERLFDLLKRYSFVDDRVVDVISLNRITRRRKEIDPSFGFDPKYRIVHSDGSKTLAPCISVEMIPFVKEGYAYSRYYAVIRLETFLELDPNIVRNAKEFQRARQVLLLDYGIDLDKDYDPISVALNIFSKMITS